MHVLKKFLFYIVLIASFTLAQSNDSDRLMDIKKAMIEQLDTDPEGLISDIALKSFEKDQMMLGAGNHISRTIERYMAKYGGTRVDVTSIKTNLDQNNINVTIGYDIYKTNLSDKLIYTLSKEHAIKNNEKAKNESQSAYTIRKAFSSLLESDPHHLLFNSLNEMLINNNQIYQSALTADIRYYLDVYEPRIRFLDLNITEISPKEITLSISYKIVKTGIEDEIIFKADVDKITRKLPLPEPEPESAINVRNAIKAVFNNSAEPLFTTDIKTLFSDDTIPTDAIEDQIKDHLIMHVNSMKLQALTLNYSTDSIKATIDYKIKHSTIRDRIALKLTPDTKQWVED